MSPTEKGMVSVNLVVNSEQIRLILMHKGKLSDIILNMGLKRQWTSSNNWISHSKGEDFLNDRGSKYHTNVGLIDWYLPTTL